MTAVKSDSPVRLAIIGTGRMAGAQVLEFKKLRGCNIVAAVDLDRERAQAFASDHGIPAVYTHTAEMLERSPVDAVSVVVPDSMHASVAIACLNAGKHVLCEKPLAENHPDALRMVTAARAAGVVHMVNLSYRNWPALHGVAAAVRAGTIGELRHVDASYLQAWLASTIWGDWRTNPALLWRLSSQHGSMGVLGDVGVHILDFATYPAGPIKRLYCQLKTFAKPENELGEFTLDANDSAVLNVEFENGALGTIHTSRWVGGYANRLYLLIAGTKGTVEIDSARSTDRFRICANGDLATCTWQDVEAPAVRNNYERFIDAVSRGEPVEPDFERGAAMQQLIDASFRSNAQRKKLVVN
jgi:predicted dehydrogenase